MDYIYINTARNKLSEYKRFSFRNTTLVFRTLLLFVLYVERGVFGKCDANEFSAYSAFPLLK